MSDKKPLLCRLGWHTSQFLDCAMFTSALRCNKCGDWINPHEGAAVEREREKWSSGELSMSFAPKPGRREIDD